MGAKVRGIRRAKANLDRIIKDVQGRKVVRALQSAMLIGSAQAALYTPIDTSTLINSQFREIMANGTRGNRARWLLCFLCGVRSRPGSETELHASNGP